MTTFYKIKLYSKLGGEHAVINEDGSTKQDVVIYPILLQEGRAAGAILRHNNLEKITKFKTIKEAEKAAKEIIKVQKDIEFNHFEIVKCYC